MSVIVTGASGQLGRLAVAGLLERVPARELILVSRSPGSLADCAERGATVRFGDFEQPGGLRGPRAAQRGRPARDRRPRAADPANAGCFELFTGTGAAIRAGYMRPVSPVVAQLTARPPGTLAQLARQYRDQAGG